MKMKKLTSITIITALSLASFAFSPIETGDKVPDFTALDENGDTWKMSDQRAAYLVIYFYPAAFTGGCTAQACSYRDNESEFSRLNAKVIGISGDEYENLGKFKEHHNLNFTLLSDQDGEIAKLFGVPLRDGGTTEREIDGSTFQLLRGVTTSRYTFVIDINRKLIYKNNNVNAANDSEAVYEFIQTHNQRKSCR